MPVIRVEQAYTTEAQTAFQRGIRGETSVLRDHICKKLNELNMERCRCIPKNVPGADWRTLQEIVKADPAREQFQVMLTHWQQISGNGPKMT